MQSPPTASNLASRRSKFFAPLTPHGMPKPPPLSPDGSIRTHRFSRMVRSPVSIMELSSPPATPMSPGSPIMLPPMSAKSFGTFIDSAPSSPAYSPRLPWSHGDSSTLLLLSPASTAPSFPEPEWDMVTPARPSAQRVTKNNSYSRSHHVSRSTSLSSQPMKPLREESQKENHPPRREESQKENHPPRREESKEEPTEEPETEEKIEEQQPRVVPLGRLATRMKSMLRRKPAGGKPAGGKPANGKPTSGKKSEKKKRYQEEYYQVGEQSHWTDM
ncbi:hypothetical protein P154DRAFT_517578 [Amniculicola lignicola CBS 123094]|uniref:Uncharacterized protein n=1 Tax=Amniculicola lignicola CBS 123094 TaxID=1392246 RepID=A0A6A5WY20_9PLEO|nr:hypothetical protein P154DRAFT_517578 [Amniculicola lignicola CBS 123094]